MPGDSVDKDYVKTHEGVYFFTYSVPQMIAVNMRFDADVGRGVKIYHQSLICSDGCGKVETITAGPSDQNAWFRQAGFTPLLPQMAFLAHPDSSLIQNCFDSTAWKHPEIQQTFKKTNWKRSDFNYARECVLFTLLEISKVGYNLGGHNSNSFITFVWRKAFLNAATLGGYALDNPNSLLSAYFRPGSKYGIFENSVGYYADLLVNWSAITVTAMFAVAKLFAAHMRQFLVVKLRAFFKRI